MKAMVPAPRRLLKKVESDERRIDEDDTGCVSRISHRHRNSKGKMHARFPIVPRASGTQIVRDVGAALQIAERDRHGSWSAAAESKPGRRVSQPRPVSGPKSPLFAAVHTPSRLECWICRRATKARFASDKKQLGANASEEVGEIR